MIQNHAKGKKNRDGARKKFDRRKHDMELWDIYDENKQPTGRTMKRNDWHMKLDVSKADGGYLFTYRRINPDEGDNYFVDVYRFVMDVKDEDLHLQEEETDGYRFATLDEIKGYAAEGKFLHYDSIRQAFEL